MNFKKLIASVSAFAIVATQVVAPLVANAQNYPAEWDMVFDYASTNWIVSANFTDALDAEFGAYTNRAQMAVFAVKAVEKDWTPTVVVDGCATAYSDRPQFPSWSVTFINKACMYALLGTTAELTPRPAFDWNTQVTRGQVVVSIIKSTFGEADAANNPEYAGLSTSIDHFAALFQEKGLMEGIFATEYNATELNQLMTRYEIIKSFMDFDKWKNEGNVEVCIPELAALLGETCPDVVTPPVTGDVVVNGALNIALNSTTPPAQYVPGTGSNIKVMKIDLMAGEDMVNVDALTFKLSGLVNRTNVTNVFVGNEDGIALTSRRSFNSDNIARVVFEGDFMIPANGKETLFVYVDTVGASNQQFQLSVVDASGVEANTANIGGMFPIVSNVVNTTNYSSTSLTFDAETNAQNNSPTSQLYVGDTNERIGRFELSAGSTNQKNIYVTAVTLRGIDTLQGVVTNLTLQAGWVNVAKSVTVNGKYVTFLLDNYMIEYGSSKNFTVFADIVWGESGDNVQLFLDDKGDIIAREESTGAALDIQFGSNKYTESYAIIEGDSLISRLQTSPASKFIPSDEKNITTLLANVYLSAEIDMENFRVFATGSAIASGDIQRVRLFVNGQQKDETSTYNVAGGYYEFSVFDTMQGSSEVMVQIDTEPNAAVGNTFKATIKPESFAFGSNSEYIASKNTVPATDIAGQAESGTFTIQTPAIQSIARTDTNGNSQKLVKGAKWVTAITVALQANSVRDLVLSSFAVQASGDVNGISTAKLYVDGNMNVLVKSNNFSAGNATFNGLNIVIPAGGTTQLTVLVDTNTSYNTALNPLTFTLKNFDIDDVDGNTVAFTNTITSAAFTVIDSASLNVSAHSTTPTEQLIQAGESTTVAQFRFRAIDDAAAVQQLAIVNVPTAFVGSAATGGTVRSMTGDGAILSLYNEANTLLGTATMSSGVANFSFIPGVPLAKDGNGSILTVKANPVGINNSATGSNYTLKLAVLWVGETIPGLSTVRTFITSNANGLDIITGNVTMANAVGYPQYVRKTQIVVSSVAAPTSTLLTNGVNKDLYKFKVATANNDEALLKRVRLNVTLAWATLSNYKIFRDNTVFASGTEVIATAGAGFVEFEFTGSFLNGFEVNNEVTFTFRADVAGITWGGDSVSVTLNEQSSDAGKYAYSAVPTPTSFVWSDQAASVTDLTTVDWFTDAYVDVLENMTAWNFAGSN